jgi:hypothetical protein
VLQFTAADSMHGSGPQPPSPRKFGAGVGFALPEDLGEGLRAGEALEFGKQFRVIVNRRGSLHGTSTSWWQ